ncbi:MAG TPA: hypothetical protein RMH99_06810 [Sandaracinaceae bacterium LLY-WYZ-13_1]|nr:hypothetical protein [Sandaracinaceae bacterium LLY-WYZ-13_1]
MTALFLVTSPGYTATKWLARTLASHPGVYCEHSAGSCALERDYTGEELAALAEEKLGRRDLEPLDVTFARLLARAGEARAAGNVHRYNRTALRRNLARFGATRAFCTANLIRHPVTWVESGSHQLARMAGYSSRIRRRLHAAHRRGAARWRALSAPTFPWPSELAFLYLCGRLSRLAAEIEDPVRHVRMEDVTRDVDALGALVRFLVGAAPDAAVLRAAVREAPVHRHRPAALAPEAQLAAWPEWKRAVLADALRTSGLVERYAAHGYDLRRAAGFRSTVAEPPTAPPLFDAAPTPPHGAAAPGETRAPALPNGSPAAGPRAGGADAARASARPRAAARPSPHAARPPRPRTDGPARSTPDARPPPIPERVWRRALSSFDRVAAREVPIRWLLEPRLRRTLVELERRLRAAGLVAGLGERAPFSPGLDGGAPPLLPAAFFAGDGWRAALVHPTRQDRSPALLCAHPTGALAVSLKGAGLRARHDSFVIRAGRCPGYRATLGRDLHTPIDVLVDHPDDEWRSHTLLGAARLGPTWMEIRNALAWHALALRHDGAPAATCLPFAVHRPREARVRVGDARFTVPIEELFVSPTLRTPAQLAQVLRDLGLRRWLRPVSAARFARALRRAPASLASDRHAALRRRVGRLYVAHAKPVVYAHVTRAKLRVGHAWARLVDDGALRALLDELGRPFDDASIRAVVEATVAEIYACHGRTPRLAEPPAELRTVEGRFAFLRAIHDANADAADAIRHAVGRTGGRSLGLLHGAGGHCLGRRLVLRDRRGEALRDAYGLALRAGAPGGGCTTDRNMTVCGEWVDTAHVFDPATDPVSRLLAWVSRWSDRWVPWASARHRPRFQRCDVELAEVSMARFDALLTGERSRVPAELDRIEAGRAERKRLEDALKTGAAPRAETVRAIEALEREAATRRRRRPELGDGTALRAFRSSYEAHRRKETERRRADVPGVSRRHRPSAS